MKKIKYKKAVLSKKTSYRVPMELQDIWVERKALKNLIDILLVVYRSKGYVHRCMIGDPMITLGLLAYGLIEENKYHVEDGRSKKIEKKNE